MSDALLNLGLLVLPSARHARGAKRYATPGLASDLHIGTETLVVSAKALARLISTAKKVDSWAEDYLYRVYVFPSQTDFGQVSGETAKDVRVWNAYLYPITLNSIDATNAEGLYFSGVTLPQIFNAFQTRTIQNIATVDGPASIDAVFVFNFDVTDANYSAIGTRGIFFGFPPNWSSKPSVRRTWKTVIEESLNNSENRINPTPRALVSLSYDVLTTSRTETERLGLLLETLKGSSVAMPLWVDQTSINSVVSIGATVINVESVEGRYFEGGQVVIMSADYLSYVSKKIISISGNSITVDAAFVDAFPSGSFIAPLVAGYFTRLPRLEWQTDSYVKTSVDFRETP